MTNLSADARNNAWRKAYSEGGASRDTYYSTTGGSWMSDLPQMHEGRLDLGEMDASAKLSEIDGGVDNLKRQLEGLHSVADDRVDAVFEALGQSIEKLRQDLETWENENRAQVVAWSGANSREVGEELAACQFKLEGWRSLKKTGEEYKARHAQDGLDTRPSAPLDRETMQTGGEGTVRRSAPEQSSSVTPGTGGAAAAAPLRPPHSEPPSVSPTQPPGAPGTPPNLPTGPNRSGDGGIGQLGSVPLLPGGSNYPTDPYLDRLDRILLILERMANTLDRIEAK